MTMRTKDFAFKLNQVNADGTFHGYGSVFGIKDSYDEIVAPGAFADTLSAHGSADTMPAMLWQHRSAEPMGAYITRKKTTSA
ncbi:MAG: HK97 family phage prohead protease [Proteobacteria bacterium]|nr:HK97 family phage prohead protease [Pseudomonadota bacterium]